MNENELFFEFRGRNVPCTRHPSVPLADAKAAIQSEPFRSWYRRCEGPQKNGKRIEIHSVEIQSVDMFGSRGVGFIKINSHCTLVDRQEMHHEHRLPGICFLRGNAVSILVALFCQDDDDDDKSDNRDTRVYSLLVEQPRVPIGHASCLELPAGMMDDEMATVAGIAVQEMKEECGIDVHPSELVDLTALACHPAVDAGHLPMAAIAPSPGGCDEFVRFMYLEKRVTRAEIEQMKGRLQGLREHGEFIVLSVVPMEDVWKISGDSKAMICLFLLQELRKEGKLPPPGELATPLNHHRRMHDTDPVLSMNTGAAIPQLAFGLYKVPNSKEGEKAIAEAIAAGYRHFDSASVYLNEETLGRAIRASEVPREQLFITSKVWNDAVKDGRAAVRASVEKSLKDVGCDYFDLFLIHWPVPGFFVDAYKELECLYRERKLRAIGISNFTPQEYEELIQGGISVTPAVNQIEASPVVYRKDQIDYFQSRGIVVFAHKALNRGGAFDLKAVTELATKHSVTAAQVMLRWGLQKGLVLAAKTLSPQRMRENRSVTSFSLSSEDMALLDSLTTGKDIREREEVEKMRKTSL